MDTENDEVESMWATLKGWWLQCMSDGPLYKHVHTPYRAWVLLRRDFNLSYIYDLHC